MQFCKRISVAIVFFILVCTSLASAATYTVTNLNDSGEGSLRLGIIFANENEGPDTIVFAVSGIIQPDSALPALSDGSGGTIIDGITAPREAHSVVINGSLLESATLTNGRLSESATHGFVITSSGNIIQGLVINQFPRNGIYVLGDRANDNNIRGNYIGTDSTGTMDLGNQWDGVMITGGALFNTVEGNIISGNGGVGVNIAGSDHNRVVGNFIGVDRSGNNVLGNEIDGIQIHDYARNNLVGGLEEGERNVISGNGYCGIRILVFADSNQVIHNRIGTNADGTAPLGNHADGVKIGDSRCNKIGGESEARNLIAHNEGAGIFIDGEISDGNTISGNSIFENVGLGIDLAPFGVTENDSLDADTGPNENLNFPVIQEVNRIYPDGNLYEISGTACPGCRVELFLVCDPGDPNCQPDPSGHGEGFYIGFTTASETGNWWFGPVGLPQGSIVSATATDESGNTSEFSFNATWPLYVTAYCGAGEEIELVVVDPAGDSIGINFNTISGAFYQEDDFDENGFIDEQVVIPKPLHGVYLIKVTPGAYALEKGFLSPYRLGVRIDGSDEQALQQLSLLQSKGLDIYVISTLMGDPSHDGVINLADVIYLANYCFGKPGYQLVPKVIGDVNCDTQVNLADVIYLARRVFGIGPPPCEPF
jgi:parallel beta-helix repeat protein